jgi:iron uptake system EfeUOB component EfeO/EfeM
VLERVPKATLNEFIHRCKPQLKAAPGPRMRVFAAKPDEIKAGRVQAKARGGKIAKVVEDSDLFTEVMTQDQQLSVDQIDGQVTEFFNNSKASVEELEAAITGELQEIVTRLADQRRYLSQFAKQNRSVTESTTAENARVAAAVQAIEAKFEARLEEMLKRREALAISVMQGIIQDKQKFIEDTRMAFERNAIIGLSENLTNLQDTLCATFG